MKLVLDIKTKSATKTGRSSVSSTFIQTKAHTDKTQGYHVLLNVFMLHYASVDYSIIFHIKCFNLDISLSGQICRKILKRTALIMYIYLLANTKLAWYIRTYMCPLT